MVLDFPGLGLSSYGWKQAGGYVVGYVAHAGILVSLDSGFGIGDWD